MAEITIKVSTEAVRDALLGALEAEAEELNEFLNWSHDVLRCGPPEDPEVIKAQRDSDKAFKRLKEIKTEIEKIQWAFALRCS